MSNSIVYQAAVLRAGKRGIIKPDAAGYYTQCIGGLDIENSNGTIYAAERARRLFDESSSLQRRIRERALRGESGHPEQEMQFIGPQNEDRWLERLNTLVEKNICVYWAEIGLDENYGRNNPHLNRPNMVGIMARYRPGGVNGHVLEKDLADPEANVSFSIRAFSIPRWQLGQHYYDLQTIVTWDYVTEPGIAYAAKTLSSTMESLSSSHLTAGQIERALEYVNPANDSGALRMVSSNESVGASRSIMELAATIKVSESSLGKPSIITRW